ncbi:MAG: energy-coupling factor transporter transmembrane protein EcfT [Desulfurococcales archaeon]|nr:energy-coupling factor transporter transmembrane protein EcfT [Desulfurococcales archaeon]
MLIEELFFLFSYVTAYRDSRGLAWRIDYRVKILMVISAWLSVFYFKSVYTIILSTLPVFIYLALTSKSLAKYILVLSSIPAIIIFFIVVIISPYPITSLTGIVRGFLLGYKVYIMSVSSMAFMTTTNPVTVSSMFRKLPRIHDYNVILARLIPLTLRDLGQVIGIQRSLGRPVYKVLFPLTLSMLRRGDELAESLYMRGYGLKSKRGVIRRSTSLNIETIVQLILSIGFPIISYIISSWV